MCFEMFMVYSMESSQSWFPSVKRNGLLTCVMKSSTNCRAWSSCSLVRSSKLKMSPT